MQNSVISTRITSLYGSQTSPIVFASVHGSKQTLWVPDFKVFRIQELAPELQVSMGPSPHLWFLQAKQRL